MSENTPIIVLEGDDARDEPTLLTLCRAVFTDFNPAYLTDRLPALADPALVVARSTTTTPVGFKFGYRRGPDLFYSWIGGVHPDHRGAGLAKRLMNAQHEWAATAGYAFMETRTRAANNRMITLNLRVGFEIVGFEHDRNGIPVVTQRKALGPTPA